jgi:hypothetical protein
MTEKPKITKLPRNGPKDGQSTTSWLYGKSFADKKWQQKIDKAKRESKKLK